MTTYLYELKAKRSKDLPSLSALSFQLVTNHVRYQEAKED